MSNYKDLLKQREALEQQIKAARDRELSDAIHQAKSIIEEFGLTADDLFGGKPRRSAAAGTKVAAKFKDPLTGQTWTGRGKPPRWIANEDREKFKI